MVLGDFGCSPQSSELDVLRKEKFCPLVPPTQFTNISTRSPQGSRCLDNIWISRSLRKIFSGKTAHSAGVSTPPEPELPVLHRPLTEGGEVLKNMLKKQNEGVVANGNWLWKEESPIG